MLEQGAECADVFQGCKKRELPCELEAVVHVEIGQAGAVCAKETLGELFTAGGSEKPEVWQLPALAYVVLEGRVVDVDLQIPQ